MLACGADTITVCTRASPFDSYGMGMSLRLASGMAGSVVLALLAGLMAWSTMSPEVAEASTGSEAPGLAAQLRHVGRDSTTGMPRWVGEGFIAAQEEAIARYGKDEREPVPPPPVDGPSITALEIPSLGVQTPAAVYGLDAFGRLDVPQDTETVGWHPAYSALPNHGGATFLAAHYEYAGRPGVFFALATLAQGEEFTLSMEDGSRHRYRVTSTLDYELGDVDMGALLQGREGMESVTLMTCSGRFVDGTYEYRTVVLAERVDEPSS